MGFTTSAAIAILLLWAFSAPARSDCKDVIALSKVTARAVESSASLQRHAERFCREHRSSAGEQRGNNFGFSYGALSASFGSRRASVSEVASRYCGGENGLEVLENAYENYVESVAPGAFQAYETCKELESSGLRFSSNRQAILPTEFNIAMMYRGGGMGQTATLRYDSSRGITCDWQTNQEGAAAADGADSVTLRAGSGAALNCSRDSHEQPGFVSITPTTLAAEPVTIGWSAYDDKGNPVDKMATLQAKVEELLGALDSFQGSVLAFDSATCPPGWEEYVPARGRFVRGIDSRADENAKRAPGSIQGSQVGPHAHEMGYNGADSTTMVPGGAAQRLAHFNDDQYGNGPRKETHSNSGAETRPDNVALLYCRRV